MTADRRGILKTAPKLAGRCGATWPDLPTLLPTAQLNGMSTLTKTKKPVRKPAVHRSTAKSRLPSFMEINPVSGLAVAKARPGAKPLTSAQVRAMLADFP